MSTCILYPNHSAGFKLDGLLDNFAYQSWTDGFPIFPCAHKISKRHLRVGPCKFVSSINPNSGTLPLLFFQMFIPHEAPFWGAHQTPSHWALRYLKVLSIPHLFSHDLPWSEDIWRAYIGCIPCPTEERKWGFVRDLCEKWTTYCLTVGGWGIPKHEILKAFPTPQIFCCSIYTTLSSAWNSFSASKVSPKSQWREMCFWSFLTIPRMLHTSCTHLVASLKWLFTASSSRSFAKSILESLRQGE